MSVKAWPLVGEKPVQKGTPSSFATLVALCVPVTSPERDPEKFTALVALVAFVTAVDPITATTCEAVAAAGGALVESYWIPLNGVAPLTAVPPGLG